MTSLPDIAWGLAKVRDTPPPYPAAPLPGYRDRPAPSSPARKRRPEENPAPPQRDKDEEKETGGRLDEYARSSQVMGIIYNVKIPPGVEAVRFDR